jgi:hypothetical protein
VHLKETHLIVIVLQIIIAKILNVINVTVNVKHVIANILVYLVKDLIENYLVVVVKKDIIWIHKIIVNNVLDIVNNAHLKTIVLNVLIKQITIVNLLNVIL